MAVEKIVTLILKAKDEASAILDGASKKLSGLGGAAKLVLAAVATATAAATGAIAATVTKVLSWGDDLGKAADRMGVTTDELNALRMAADLSGISTNDLERAFRRMSRSIADGLDGSKAQVEAFQQLGISLDDLSRMSPAQAFETIIGALDGVEDQTKKTQLAFDIFGRAGTSMFNLTTESITLAKQEIEEFGLGLSRVDAAKMEEVNDSFTRIKLAMQGVGVQLTIALLDPLKELALRFVELSKDGTLREWADKVGRSFGDLITWFTELTTKTQDIGNAFTILGGMWQGMVGTFQVAGNAIAYAIITPIESVLQVLNAATFGRIGWLDDAANQAREFRDVAGQAFLDGGGKIKDGVIDIADGVSGLADPTSQLNDRLQEIGKESEDAGESLGDLGKEAADSATEMDVAKASSEKLAREQKKLAIEADKAAKELIEAKVAAAEMAAEMEKIASNERIQTLEMAFNFNIEKLKADTQVAISVIESISDSIGSISGLVGGMFDTFADSEFGYAQSKMSQWIQQALDDQSSLVDAQVKLANVQTALAQLKINRIGSGDALIRIDSEGLEPALEQVLWSIMEKVQLRVAMEQSELLLGLGAEV